MILKTWKDVRGNVGATSPEKSGSEQGRQRDRQDTHLGLGITFCTATCMQEPDEPTSPGKAAKLDSAKLCVMGSGLLKQSSSTADCFPDVALKPSGQKLKRTLQPWSASQEAQHNIPAW
ncbi:Hypothetical predicted protein [Marmota monax]|uniref:Uncharacterized protein n=1 Tax=Marmota monax TaxID=9995 RepID=A0A5E4ARW9_MARMO|nr:hypothetical protein GHT09_016567 [Marmota monax]VTJ60088.1 Hypothetical predicted protein [Marmota monax]